MRLLAERVAPDEPLRRFPRAIRVAGGQALRRDVGEGILVAVCQPLALRGEAVVPESLGEVATVERHGCLGAAGGVGDAGLEAIGVQEMDGVGSQSERLGVRLEHRIEVQPRSRQGAAHLVQGLAQRTGGGDHRLRPEVGRDGLAGPRSAGQHEQREQRLRMATHEPDLLPGRGTDREAAEERDLQAKRGGGTVSHDVPSRAWSRRPAHPPGGPDVGL